MLRVGLIRVVSDSTSAELTSHGRMITETYPDLEVVSVAIAGFPDGIHTRALAEAAVPAVLSAADSVCLTVDALAVSCTEDPGLEELRHRFAIPVVGAGSALGWACLSIGRPVGVLTIFEHVPAGLRQVGEVLPMALCRVHGARTTRDLRTRPQEILRAASELVRDGSEVIALGCTGFSTVSTASYLATCLNSVVLLDPVRCMGALLRALTL